MVNRSNRDQKQATEATKKMNVLSLDEYPFHDNEDFINADRGFIATTNRFPVDEKSGAAIWTLKGYKFLDRDTCAPTVNPSLWRQSQLNMTNGLYEVVKDAIYQIRGFDLSVMTIIEGKDGLIVIDPLVSAETAACGLDVYREHRTNKPVIAVIYTHSHADHYGGVKGVVDETDVINGDVKIFAPENFMEEVVSENIYVGNAMTRRSFYMYGQLLPRSEKGQVDAGLGKSVSLGTVTLIEPTDYISHTGETRHIGGVEFVFQMAPDTEAPAELLFYLPEFKALCSSEVATHTLHNIYTLRGAKVRDSANWWKVINESIDMFGDKTDVVFASHHWPIWGNKNVLRFLTAQRDIFKFIHDQTLRLANKGYGPVEIAEILKPPKSLSNVWNTHGYYGSLNHNVKAVYQRYLGWYDSNPANLYTLPPVENGKKYVEYMGGADAIIEKARSDFDKGEYRFVVEVLKHVVFADPDNTDAKNLQADAFEQLGYQSENPTWRNEFLMGAHELRHGLPPKTSFSSMGESAGAIPTSMMLDYLGICLNGEKAESLNAIFNLHITDRDENYVLNVENSTLTYSANKVSDTADTSIEAPYKDFLSIVIDKKDIESVAKRNGVKIDGSTDTLKKFIGMLDEFELLFNIVTP